MLLHFVTAGSFVLAQARVVAMWDIPKWCMQLSWLKNKLREYSWNQWLYCKSSFPSIGHVVNNCQITNCWYLNYIANVWSEYCRSWQLFTKIYTVNSNMIIYMPKLECTGSPSNDITLTTIEFMPRRYRMYNSIFIYWPTLTVAP